VTGRRRLEHTPTLIREATARHRDSGARPVDPVPVLRDKADVIVTWRIGSSGPLHFEDERSLYELFMLARTWAWLRHRGGGAVLEPDSDRAEATLVDCPYLDTPSFPCPTPGERLTRFSIGITFLQTILVVGMAHAARCRDWWVHARGAFHRSRVIRGAQQSVLSVSRRPPEREADKVSNARRWNFGLWACQTPAGKKRAAESSDVFALRLKRPG